MDRMTVGELLALYYGVGMTAEINDGHLIRVNCEEDE